MANSVPISHPFFANGVIYTKKDREGWKLCRVAFSLQIRHTTLINLLLLLSWIVTEEQRVLYSKPKCKGSFERVRLQIGLYKIFQCIPNLYQECSCSGLLPTCAIWNFPGVCVCVYFRRRKSAAFFLYYLSASFPPPPLHSLEEGHTFLPSNVLSHFHSHFQFNKSIHVPPSTFHEWILWSLVSPVRTSADQ